MSTNVNIIARTDKIYNDRLEAGMLLAEALKNYQSSNAVILGIPRGGVIVAGEIADGLNADLDVMFSRKIGVPGHDEYAIGAVSEEGDLFLNQRAIRHFQVPSDYIFDEKERQLNQLARRALVFRVVYKKVPVEGRTVIITDDGVATGATMQAALWAVRHENPKQVIVALPVGVEQMLNELSKDADEVICLRVPPVFHAIGQFYRHFEQVSDPEVLAILENHLHSRN